MAAFFSPASPAVMNSLKAPGLRWLPIGAAPWLRALNKQLTGRATAWKYTLTQNRRLVPRNDMCRYASMPKQICVIFFLPFSPPMRV